MIGDAKRVRELRQRTGRKEHDLAALLGMSSASYFDIEANDDELEMVLSLRQVKLLAEHLGVSTAELFGKERVPTERRLEYRMLVVRTEDYLRSAGISEETLVEQVGWELRDFFTSEDATLDNYPVDFLKSLCDVLQVPWTHALP
jgi:transcriptional regulator with XRE-family HTH domain